MSIVKHIPNTITCLNLFSGCVASIMAVEGQFFLAALFVLLAAVFDFLDVQGDINKFAVYAVGDRAKAVNDSNVKAIYFREIPNVVWLGEAVTDEERSKYISSMPGYTYCNMSEALETLLTVSAQGKDAKTVLDGFLSTHTHGADTMSISCIPIYHLQPNTKIYVEDKENKIEGEYVLQRLTIPLTYNGMMSLSGYKYVQNLY